MQVNLLSGGVNNAYGAFEANILDHFLLVELGTKHRKMSRKALLLFMECDYGIIS